MTLDLTVNRPQGSARLGRNWSDTPAELLNIAGWFVLGLGALVLLGSVALLAVAASSND